MDQIKDLLKVKNNRFRLVVLLVLLVALPLTYYLSQNTQIFRPKAAGTATLQFLNEQNQPITTTQSNRIKMQVGYTPQAAAPTVPNIADFELVKTAHAVQDCHISDGECWGTEFGEPDECGEGGPAGPGLCWERCQDWQCQQTPVNRCDPFDTNGDAEYTQFSHCSACNHSVWYCSYGTGPYPVYDFGVDDGRCSPGGWAAQQSGVCAPQCNPLNCPAGNTQCLNGNTVRYPGICEADGSCGFSNFPEIVAGDPLHCNDGGGGNSCFNFDWGIGFDPQSLSVERGNEARFRVVVEDTRSANCGVENYIVRLHLPPGFPQPYYDQLVNLQAGTSSQVTYWFNTSNMNPGNHSFRAEAWRQVNQNETVDDDFTLTVTQSAPRVPTRMRILETTNGSNLREVIRPYNGSNETFDWEFVSGSFGQKVITIQFGNDITFWPDETVSSSIAYQSGGGGGGTSDRPDLVLIDPPRITTNPINANTPFNATVTVRNLEPVAAARPDGKVRVSWLLTSQGSTVLIRTPEFTETNTIPPNGLLDVQKQLAGLPNGNYSLRAVIDYESQISEKDEFNNTSPALNFTVGTGGGGTVLNPFASLTLNGSSEATATVQKNANNTITVNARGTRLTGIKVYKARQPNLAGSTALQGPGADSDLLMPCPGFPSTCTKTLTWTESQTGQWYIFMEVRSDSDGDNEAGEPGEKCTGSNEQLAGLADCGGDGGRDIITVTVNDSNVSPSPSASGGAGGCVPIQGIPCPSVSPSPSPSPSVPVTARVCPVLGDATDPCDGRVTIADFTIWKEEFLGTRATKRANFNPEIDQNVTVTDFTIWKTEFLKTF